MQSIKQHLKVGIVSYRVDGLEQSLTPTDFSTLSIDYLENLNLKTGKIVATSNECGKVIDNFKCYIATVTASENAKDAKVGDNVKIRLPNNKEVTSQIAHISQENDKYLIILEVDKEIEELINYRKISFNLIWWSQTGLKVPNQAIVEQDGQKYVVRSRAGYLSKILVKVTKQNENYSIIDSYNVDELRKLGFSDSEINSYKKIYIYDEILINPNLEKVE